MKSIHIGSIIKQKVKERFMTKKEFADKIICGRTNVYNIFKKQSINSDLIYRISKALNYDFYNEVYFGRKTNHFSKKIHITIEFDGEKIDKSDLLNKLIKLLSSD